MQFKVPQFLEIEDKIFGPFTFKQLAYLVGGFAICFVLHRVLGWLYGIIPMILVAGFTAALTFYRPNGKPFVHMLESAFIYFTQSKLYLWKRKIKKGIEQKDKESAQKIEVLSQHKVNFGGEKLKNLAWSLDVLDLSKNNINDINK